jgi:CRP-like cAMP-binding protein
MNQSEAIQIITNLYPYGQMTAESIMAFGNIATYKEVEKDTILLKEGQTMNSVYFILKGCCREFYRKESGLQVTDWFAFEQDFITSINSFYTGTPSKYYVETLEDCQLLEIKRDDLMMLAFTYPEVAHFQSFLVTKTMLALQSRITSMQFESAEQKYNSLLAEKPEIHRVMLTHIASYLGISLETLSRIRKPKKRI